MENPRSRVTIYSIMVMLLSFTHNELIQRKLCVVIKTVFIFILNQEAC